MSVERSLRTWHLTDAGHAAIGASPSVLVPLVDLPWRDETRDLRPDTEDRP